MKLFIIPSWYPTNLHPESGSFFQDRAILINKTNIQVYLIASIQHSFRDIFHSCEIKGNSFEIYKNLPTYKNETINIFPKIERKAFYRYQKNTINYFNDIVKKVGKPDLVFFNSSLWAGSALSKHLYKNLIPYIVSEHLKEFLLPYGFNAFQYRHINQTYNNCSKIIATSSALKDAIANQFNSYKNKLAIIPNPVDEDIFTLKPQKGIKNSITIICIALFRPEKRLDIIISAINSLIKKRIKVTLKIIGDGPLKSTITKKTKSLGIVEHIQFLGYLNQHEIVRELHLSDLFVLASDVETFGVALVEAQMCGLPAVCTDCGGPRDIISKQTGVLVKPNSIKSLANGINETIDKLDQFNSKEIRELTISKFGVKTYTKAIMELAQNII